MNKKEMPAKKRLRVPTQKMKDREITPLPNEQSKCFAFVRWEDGYTGKILTSFDILARDEGSVELQDLRSGDPVLAKWSDGKFYKATVEYISEDYQFNQAKGHQTSQKSFLNLLKEDEPLDSSGSDTVIINRSPLSEHGEEVTAPSPSPDGGHATGRSFAGPQPNGSNRGGTTGPSPYGDHTPSPSLNGLGTSHSSSHGDHTHSPSTYGLNTSDPHPYGDYTPSPSRYSNTSGPPRYGHHTPIPSWYSNTSGQSSYEDHTLSPPARDRNMSGPLPGGCNAAGSPAGRVNPPESRKAASLPLARRDASNSSDQSNILPGQQAQNAWTPCDGCKEEVERILHEKRRIDEVIARIDPDQVRELQTLCNLIGESHRVGPSLPSGQQELFPGCGVFISSFRLAAMNHASKPHCMRLFHALFDHFFTVEECQNAVPFGRPGNNPSGKEGKRILDRKKVDAILTYVLRCATLPGWEQIEEARLKKAFVNKCRARAGSKE